MAKGSVPSHIKSHINYRFSINTHGAGSDVGGLSRVSKGFGYPPPPKPPGEGGSSELAIYREKSIILVSYACKK